MSLLYNKNVKRNDMYFIIYYIYLCTILFIDNQICIIKHKIYNLKLTKSWFRLSWTF